MSRKRTGGPRFGNRRAGIRGSPTASARARWVKFPIDRQQPGAVVSARDHPVAADLAMEYLDPGFQEPHAGVPASGAGFSEEVQSHLEPAQHVLCLSKGTKHECGYEYPPTFCTPAETSGTGGQATSMGRAAADPPGNRTSNPVHGHSCHSRTASLVLVARGAPPFPSCARRRRRYTDIPNVVKTSMISCARCATRATC
jgi:hypothetical protein